MMPHRNRQTVLHDHRMCVFSTTTRFAPAKYRCNLIYGKMKLGIVAFVCRMCITATLPKIYLCVITAKLLDWLCRLQTGVTTFVHAGDIPFLLAIMCSRVLSHIAIVGCVLSGKWPQRALSHFKGDCNCVGWFQ